MTHKTGPRPKVMASLSKSLQSAVLRSGATISETFLGLHEIEMMLVRKMLKPWEDETCPTCPRDLDKKPPKRDWLDELFDD